MLLKTAFCATAIAGVLAAQAFAPNVEATLLKDEDVSGKKEVCFSVQTKHIGNGLIIHAYFTQPTSGYIELNGANGKHGQSFKKEDFHQLQTDSDAGFYRLTLEVEQTAHVKELTAQAYNGDTIREQSCRSDAKKK